MTKAATMVPVKRVVVVRDGKRVSPEIGKPFKFTGDEIDAVGVHPKDKNGSLRSSVNELVDDPDNDGAGDNDGKNDAGQKSPAADGSDGKAPPKAAAKAPAKADDDL